MCNDPHRPKIKEWRKIYQANGEQKKKSRGCNPRLWSNRIYTNKDQKKQRTALHNGKGINSTRRANYLNIYAPSTGAPRYIKQVLNDLQREFNSHTIIVEDFNTPLSIWDRSTRQKINKDIQDLNSYRTKQT